MSQQQPEHKAESFQDGVKHDATRSRQRTVTREAVDFWYDKQHKDLLFYLSIGIVFLELIVGGVAFFYGVIHAKPAQNGLPPQFQFPWLAYSIAAVVAPATLLLIVHLAGVGLFRSLRDTRAEDEEWRKDLPERLRKVYAIVQGAPTVLLLVGIMGLGAALFYIDGAMSALFRLGGALEVYIPWIMGSIVGGLCLAYLGRLWLSYRTKKMEAEYQFRREVLERTGVIIVDRGSVQLPPSLIEDGSFRVLESGTGLALAQGGQAMQGQNAAGPIVDGAVIVDAPIVDRHVDTRVTDAQSIDSQTTDKPNADSPVVDVDPVKP